VTDDRRRLLAILDRDLVGGELSQVERLESIEVAANVADCILGASHAWAGAIDAAASWFRPI